MSVVRMVDRVLPSASQREEKSHPDSAAARRSRYTLSGARLDCRAVAISSA